MNRSAQQDIAGVVLAGGRSQRMGTGKDKFLLKYNDKTLLEHVIDLAQAQVSQLLITINGEAQRIPATHYPLINDNDQYGENAGPIAGILTAMQHLSRKPSSLKWLATFPADASTFPKDWVAQCYAQLRRENHALGYANSSDGPHYTFALLSLDLFEDLESYFESGGRSLKGYYHSREAIAIRFPPTQFSNINTPEDLQRALNAGEAHDPN